MSTVFSEVYGTYYNVVAKVLTQALAAVGEKLSRKCLMKKLKLI